MYFPPWGEKEYSENNFFYVKSLRSGLGYIFSAMLILNVSILSYIWHKKFMLIGSCNSLLVITQSSGFHEKKLFSRNILLLIKTHHREGKNQAKF